MVCDTLSDGYVNARANKGEAHARISNHHGHTCEHVLTRGHTRARVRIFTLCLCRLSEPAKLSFLLLSEVSQCDPLELSTCSSHSQTAEAAVDQYRAEIRWKRERERDREKEEESTARESCRTHYSTDTATAPRKASK